MTRSAAREIAVHFTFELGFSDLSADQLLERDLTPEFFALLGEEEPLYAQFPDKIQLEYIQKIVRGVFAHGAELDNDIAKYAKGWRFARIDRVAAAIMRMYPIRRPSMKRWRLPRSIWMRIQSNLSMVSWALLCGQSFLLKTDVTERGAEHEPGLHWF